MIKKIFCILLLLFAVLPVWTLAASNMQGKRIVIESSLLGESREFQVLLPENYYADPSTRYPVLYLLDGDYLFHGASGLLDLLANKGQLIPDVILVGIADKGTDKYRQYMTPKGLTAPLKEQDNGRASEFLAHINSELTPYIEKNYRTADNTILFGHSIGGLFVLNALLESPDAFTDYLSSSPSVWLNDYAFVKRAKKVFAKSQHEPVSLYLSLGDETRMGQYGLIDVLDDLQPKNINWHFKHYPDENHVSVALFSLRHSLKKIFSGWFIAERELNKIESPDALLDHYKPLLAAFNINQAIPTPSVRAAISYFYRNKKQADINQFMLRVNKELPASEAAFVMMLASYVGHFDSPQAGVERLLDKEENFKHSIEFIKAIAVAYEKAKDNKLAFDYYQKALTLAKEQNANQWQVNIIEAKLLQTKVIENE
ncbi:alpha/beta hydrolase [Shewanella surugensis]|uniref:Alpha/beta hydrolase n=1 Tax=Shewanella surugensis TaxID=212020 RepID=A0ABT0L6B1_9GAMM|nr:alpha/beta hydrolase-fold protein [Shewanella surugensis]MCL1123227.1 alpha/beta hydrolase [Shewanella surugensis]